MNARPTSRTRRVAAGLVALSPMLAIACKSPPVENVATASAPTGQVAAVCDQLAAGPDQAPSGAVQVDPSVEGDLRTKTKANPPGTTFWLRKGIHRLGSGQYDQVVPKEGNTYLGAPGAVVDGRMVNQYAFTGKASGVTIKYLTVRGFAAPHDEGVVNHDSGDGWVIEHNLIENNAGAGMMAGAGQQVRGNCLRRNGQYGINAFKSGNTITGLLIEGNEIVGNNTGDWEARKPGCGCTGGMKFWAVNGADVRDNWIHDNRGPGMWADTNNNDFMIEGNLIEANDGAAIVFETSYNAVIRHNTMRRNNWEAGRDYADRGDNFPVATVYLSESGGEPRVPARTDKIDFYGNVLEDNWSGLTLWENADRFCNSPANTSSDSCTLLVADQQRCSEPDITSPPLYSDCRWKTQRVDIHDNRFVLNPAAIGCRTTCGRMGLLSNFGTYPDWSPYQGETVQKAITFDQQNRWRNNTYLGPWSFVPYDASRVMDHTQWQLPPYEQDEGSMFGQKGGG